MSAIKEQLHDQIEAGQRQGHKIGWLNMPGYRPETWNPVIGCSKVSPGCDNCYAEVMARRIAGMKQVHAKDYRYTLMPDEKNKLNGWNGHTIFRYEILQEAMQWKQPRMVFVCSMSDLFHEQTDFEKISAVFSVMSDLDQHIFIVLTKRPERMLEFYQWKQEQFGVDIEWRPSSNVWIGVTAENQEQANKRIPVLNHIWAAVKFVSIEPMLGPIDFGAALGDTLKYHAGGLKNCLSWVICGGETGPKARPMHPDWVRSVRDQCKSANVPFFFKSWGTWCPEGTIKNYSFLNPSKEKVMGVEVMTKKPVVRNHDTLDGQQHQEWPKI